MPIRANIAALGRQQQRLHRGLPFFGIVFGLWQFGDVERGVAERCWLLSLLQQDAFVETCRCISLVQAPEQPHVAILFIH